MPLPTVEVALPEDVLSFAHLRFVDGEEVVEQLTDDVDFELGGVKLLDSVPYAIVEIYMHAFGERGEEVDDPEACVALALMITLARVDMPRVSDRHASITTS